MNAARFNPNAVAKAQGLQPISGKNIGDGFAFVGFTIEAVPAEGGKVMAVLVGHGCRPSPLVAETKVIGVPLGEVGELDLSAFKAKVAEALGDKWEPAPEQVPA